MRSTKFKDEYKAKLQNYLLEKSNLVTEMKNLEKNISDLLKDSYREYVIDKNELKLCENNRIYIPLKGVMINLVDLDLSENKVNNYVSNKKLDDNELIPNLNGKTLCKSVIPKTFTFNYLDNEIQLPAIISKNKPDKLLTYSKFSDDINKIPEKILNKIKTAFIDYCRLIHKVNNFTRINAINGKTYYDIGTIEELKIVSDYWYNIVIGFIEESKKLDIFPNNYNIEETLKKLKNIIEE